MDPLLPAKRCGSPGAHSARIRKNAEAYGDSPALESLNATVLVEFPLSKGRISLRFLARSGVLKIPNNLIKSNIKAAYSFSFVLRAADRLCNVPAG
jgi:hypothetical protein